MRRLSVLTALLLTTGTWLMADQAAKPAAAPAAGAGPSGTMT
jgi:hypothetical protein